MKTVWLLPACDVARVALAITLADVTTAGGLRGPGRGGRCVVNWDSGLLELGLPRRPETGRAR